MLITANAREMAQETLGGAAPRGFMHDWRGPHRYYSIRHSLRSQISQKTQRLKTLFIMRRLDFNGRDRAVSGWIRGCDDNRIYSAVAFSFPFGAQL